MSEKLIDNFGRHINYLRLSVTDRCNLRCTYCMSEDMIFLPKSKVMSLEEMLLVAQAFSELGVSKIRLTGGEPLVRNGVMQLVDGIAKLPNVSELVMTTNGVLLNEFASPLAKAGVSRLNISLDSLQPQRFIKIARVGSLETVLSGIQAAKQAGFKRIKINSVIQKGVNDDEVIDLLEFALTNQLDIVFIEEMPLGEISSDARLQTQHSSKQILDVLGEKYQLQKNDDQDPAKGPSRYYQVKRNQIKSDQLEGYQSKIGFISPMTNNFCASCNRVRVTAEGQLLLCLGNEHSLDLREIIRSSDSDIDLLKWEIVKSMQSKPERHYFDPNQITIKRHMSHTGG